VSRVVSLFLLLLATSFGRREGQIADCLRFFHRSCPHSYKYLVRSKADGGHTAGEFQQEGGKKLVHKVIEATKAPF